MTQSEAEARVSDNALRLGSTGALLSPENLLEQLPYEQWENRNLYVRCSTNGQWVPVELRALHRVYGVYAKPPGVSLSLNGGNAKSFVHRIQPPDFGIWQPHTVYGFNSPYLTSISSGCVLLSNDLMWHRYFGCHPMFGTGGLFRLHFCFGTPVEVAQNLEQILRNVPEKDTAGFFRGEFVKYEVSGVQRRKATPEEKEDVHRVQERGEGGMEYSSSSFSKPQGAGFRIYSASTEGESSPKPVLDSAGAASSSDVLYLDLRTQMLRPGMIQKIRQHAVSSVECLGYEHLDAQKMSLLPGEYRSLRDEEIQVMEEALRRVKTRTVVSHLRDPD